MDSFWKKLTVPFLVLAPMEDVTDYAFREMFVSALPRPDVFFTEFTSADGLCSKGREETIRRFKYSDRQRPIVAQIWGTDPHTIYEAARLAHDMKFDGIDLNMGCPVPAVTKHGAGSGLIKNPALAKDLIEAVKKGAPCTAISVKTRLGFAHVNTEEWIAFLLHQKLDAITIHARIAVQMSTGDADWGEIAKAVTLRDAISPGTIIIGNGDVMDYAQAVGAHKKYGADGIMIGRGVFHNPWVFEKTTTPLPHSKDEYLSLLLQHLELFNKTWGKEKNFQIMKKFFKMYVKGFNGANELRQHLMDSRTPAEVRSILASFLSS